MTRLIGPLGPQPPPAAEARLPVVRCRMAGAPVLSPGPRYYAQVKDRCNGKRAALSEARKILRQACHILAELGDDALAPA
jgi:transposase